MSKTFELKSKYSPAGDQPEAIRQLVAGVDAGLLKQTLLGVTGSGKTYTMANVIAQCQRPAIIMAHNKTLAAQLYGEFKDFFQKPMCPHRILLLTRTPRSTNTLSRCGCRPPRP